MRVGVRSVRTVLRAHIPFMVYTLKFARLIIKISYIETPIVFYNMLKMYTNNYCSIDHEGDIPAMVHDPISLFKLIFRSVVFLLSMSIYVRIRLCYIERLNSGNYCLGKVNRLRR